MRSTFDGVIEQLKKDRRRKVGDLFVDNLVIIFENSESHFMQLLVTDFVLL